MSSFNKVLLMGNLTRDPQLKMLPGNSVVVEFGMASSRRYRTATGEDREDTAYVDCAAFGRQAEVINQFFKKGKPIFIEGRLKFDAWDDNQSGAKRSKLSVVVENFQFIGGRDIPSNQPGSNAVADTVWRRPAGDGNQPAEPPRTRTKNAQLPFDKEAHFEEADIPF